MITATVLRIEENRTVVQSTFLILSNRANTSFFDAGKFGKFLTCPFFQIEVLNYCTRRKKREFLVSY